MKRISFSNKSAHDKGTCNHCPFPHSWGGLIKMAPGRLQCLGIPSTSAERLEPEHIEGIIYTIWPGSNLGSPLRCPFSYLLHQLSLARWHRDKYLNKWWNNRDELMFLPLDTQTWMGLAIWIPLGWNNRRTIFNAKDGYIHMDKHL